MMLPPKSVQMYFDMRIKLGTPAATLAASWDTYRPPPALIPTRARRKKTTKTTPASSSEKDEAGAKRAREARSVQAHRARRNYWEIDSRSAARVIRRAKAYSNHVAPANSARPRTLATGAYPSPIKDRANGESEPVAPAMPA